MSEHACGGAKAAMLHNLAKQLPIPPISPQHRPHEFPGIFLLDTKFAPAGQGAEKGVQVEGTRQYRNAQFMTPETRSSTHFFWNYLNDFDIDNPNISLSLRNSLEEAFNEDLAIIEAQQKVFDADPNYQLLPIGADAALTYFRWVLARRIEAERNAAKAA
jgi:phenylpropionate dioxygenase-like ring-hydroxylating dioxygenase large terminal subunit